MASSVFLDFTGGDTFTGQMIGPAANNTAAPPYSFLGDLTTGYASRVAGELDLIAAGTNALKVNATSLDSQFSANGDVFWRLANTNVGTGAFASIAVVNAASNFDIYKLGSGFTTSGQYVQNATLMEDNGAAGLFLSTSHASGVIRFYTNSVLRATIAAAGGTTFTSTVDATAYSQGGVVLTSATAPTVASGFGTGAAVAHSNGTAAFTVGVGTTTGNTGVITMPAAPNGWAAQCTNLSTQSTTVAYTKQVATSQTSITIGNFTDIAGAGPWANSDVISIVAFPY